MGVDKGLVKDLAGAVARSEFFAVYQPQIALETGTFVAVEALCRWQHPERGLVPPAVFIPVAEKAGLIHEIGRFMLDECLLALDVWRDLPTPVEISVNVSPAQLAGGEFEDHLHEQMQRRGLPHDALTIEVTETRVVGELDVMVSRLDRVRSLGVGVALDDYGKGHSSALRLEQLPVTELKLDRSLIKRGAKKTDPQLAATVSQARARGLRVVAEGVETDVHQAFAQHLGCDRAQGYYYSVPLPRQAVEERLRA